MQCELSHIKGNCGMIKNKMILILTLAFYMSAIQSCGGSAKSELSEEQKLIQLK